MGDIQIILHVLFCALFPAPDSGQCWCFSVASCSPESERLSTVELCLTCADRIGLNMLVPVDLPLFLVVLWELLSTASCALIEARGKLLSGFKREDFDNAASYILLEMHAFIA